MNLEIRDISFKDNSIFVGGYFSKDKGKTWNMGFFAQSSEKYCFGKFLG
jgi:hypothetical protein